MSVRTTLRLLKLIAQGEEDIKNGRTRPQRVKKSSLTQNWLAFKLSYLEYL